MWMEEDGAKCAGKHESAVRDCRDFSAIYIR